MIAFSILLILAVLGPVQPDIGGPTVSVCGDGICHYQERGICSTDCGTSGAQVPATDFSLFPTIQETQLILALVIGAIILALVIFYWGRRRHAWTKLEERYSESRPNIGKECR
ncbi:MAG: hypothetical protein KKA90_03600 [Nanoarchaeota archaeon]|nr:hypothetical protein [Nanoarchaeota archaeon]